MKKLIKLQDENKEEKISQAFNAGELIDQPIEFSKIYLEKSEEFLNKNIETANRTADMCDYNLPAEEISDLHAMSLSLAKEIYAKVANNEPLECGSINLCVDKIADQLIIDNNFSPLSIYGTNADYLSSHAVNVCIMSLKVGIGIGYDSSKLTELGMSAFLHDIGMIKYLGLAGQPRKLTMEEYKEIKNHPILSSELLKKAKKLPESVINTTLQQHERIDGSGYPHGLRGESIDDNARILNIADTYDALTNSRPYQDEYEPFRAVKKILSLKSSFDNNIIKAFIDTVGIFPVGSLVRLNNGEVGKVAEVRKGFPLRPVIHILYNNKNEKIENMKVIDLQKQFLIYIAEGLKKDEGVERT
jgi:HD-GYP domain-containing protein (c-di-GMP phosphodiesterase class II)